MLNNPVTNSNNYSQAAGSLAPDSQTGRLAPDFDLPSIQGTTIRLSDYRGKKRVILWFSRGFTCPFCRSHMANITEGYQRLMEQNVEVIQVAPNLQESAITFFRDEQPPYPFVCDPDKRLYAMYGIGDKGILKATRNAFVSFGTAAVRQEFGTTVQASWLDVANKNFLRRLHHHALTALDQAIIFIDEQGVVCHRLDVDAVNDIPETRRLLQLLEENTA